MPTRCTEAATYSGIGNSRPPGRTHADKPDKPDRTSAPEQAPPSKPSQLSTSPKPECASEPPSRYARPTPEDNRPPCSVTSQFTYVRRADSVPPPPQQCEARARTRPRGRACRIPRRNGTLTNQPN